MMLTTFLRNHCYPDVARDDLKPDLRRLTRNGVLAWTVMTACIPLFAGQGTQTIWNATSGGSDTYGCGYDPATGGTIRNQSTQAYVAVGTSVGAAFDNLSNTRVTANGTTITFGTGSGYTPSAADKGIFIHCISGCSTARDYEVTSTGSNTWGVDNSLFCVGCNPMVFIAGGACSSVAGMLSHSQFVANRLTHRFEFNNPQIINAAISVGTSGMTAPVAAHITGYYQNWDDLATCAIDPTQTICANRPTITVNGAVDGFDVFTPLLFENFILDGNGTTRGLIGINACGTNLTSCNVLNQDVQFGLINVEVKNFSYTGVVCGGHNGPCGAMAIQVHDNCQVANANSIANYIVYDYGGYLTQSYFNNPLNGCRDVAYGAVATLGDLDYNIFMGGTGTNHCLTQDEGIATLQIENNDFYGCGSAGYYAQDGAFSEPAMALSSAMNNIFVNNVGYAFNFSGSGQGSWILTWNNPEWQNWYFGNNSGGNQVLNMSLKAADVCPASPCGVLSTGNPFNGPTANPVDMSLNYAIGQGITAQRSAWPQNWFFVGLSSVNSYPSYGAIAQASLMTSSF
jgi:hypothetical protein